MASPDFESSSQPVVLATRGSALALAQAEGIRAHFEALFPHRRFEIRVIRTTGDQLQSAQPADAGVSLPRGLFTKELEVALLERTADIAVHSLKDLPTELPEGLVLAATPPRADPREVLLYRDAEYSEFLESVRPPADWSPGRRQPYFGRPRAGISGLPKGAVVATSSPRRAAQVRSMRPDVEVVPIRGNVGTRLAKVRNQWDLDATLLAAAGLLRLHLDLGPRGVLRLDPRLPAARRAELPEPPSGLLGYILEPEEMLPAVGQGAIALETRSGDPGIAELCSALNHLNTFQAVTAERAFLAAMGGGCQAPVAALARVLGHQLELRAASYHQDPVRQVVVRRPVREAVQLGESVAAQLR
ncbi:MAG: hydroxymethylbilane synthase [Verrucomicrobiales bacterium]|nr:hydroxymethylbilane synthase [Verrucomicrobiales bacterium]